MTSFFPIWVKQSGLKVHCIDEVYTSDAHIDAYNELQKQPNKPGCTLEKIILVLMFWSDSTQLANFGTAKVWPLYLFLGNLSKYFRSKPSSGACHHVAYIPSVSPIIRFFKSFTDSLPSASRLRTGCHTGYMLAQPEKLHHDTLSSRAYAACMENHSWWRLQGGIHTRVCSWVLGW